MIERRQITVHGIVQGVGFRPFVFALANALSLGGFVRNETDGVRIEVEGDSSSLDRFLQDLHQKLPPLARIDRLSSQPQAARGEVEFHITSSAHTDCGQIVITPDAATCDECLAEMFDPRDRRFRYPFINCTNCGPRLTIVVGAPYDRAKTTMAKFKMCAACLAEYDDPTNRRFHAQPNACPVCGPKLSALDADGSPVATGDPLVWFAQQMRDGRIGAMKGLGGYHLVCDARNESAVAELRRRKQRDEKPFAVMVANLEAAKSLCEIDESEAKLLHTPRCPIVLLKKKPNANLAGQIAPQNPNLGLMLPYTPLHHLLFSALSTKHSALVMTSGNLSDEPIAYQDASKLRGIADVFLTHDRPIHVRCDDSVTRMIGKTESPIRRSRGYAPQPIALPFDCPRPILAVGGQLKNTFALASGRVAIVSHHMGDLDHLEAYRAFERDIALYQDLFAHKPAIIAHDLHPDYASTRYAARFAAERGIPTIAVQHHHAHLASCMTEHGLSGPVIGVIFDGTGFGLDETIWGGEILAGDCKSFTRAAHLRPVALPGGEAAVHEPWRMAVSYLLDAGVECDAFASRHDANSLRTIRQMIERGVNSPMTSSAGRLFDAVAALVGVRDRVTFEGQAAMQLEWLASSVAPESAYPISLLGSQVAVDQDLPLTLDARALIVEIAHDVNARVLPAKIARRFHSTLAQEIANVCERVRAKNGLNAVLCSGGTFMNALLSLEVGALLTRSGFQFFRHHTVPPNDGGLSLGQLAVAAAQLSAQTSV